MHLHVPADLGRVTGTGVLTEVTEQQSDAALIAAVRDGDRGAYGMLYQRHLGAAWRVAGSLAGSPVEREGVTAEAFALVLRALRTGVWPGH